MKDFFSLSWLRALGSSWGISLILGSCAIAPVTVKRDERPLFDRVEAARQPQRFFEKRLPQAIAGNQDALAQMIEEMVRHGASEQKLTDGRVLRLRVKSAQPFERVDAADRLSYRGLDRIYNRAGEGVALVGFRKNRGTPSDAYFPPEGIFRPLNGSIRSVSAREVLIEIRCPQEHPSLAADWTAAWADLLSRTGHLRSRGLGSFLTEAADDDAGFFLMQDYDPRLRPLIMVHGLLSTPLAWANLTNDLWGDDRIRERYQIWHYHYPTNAPAMYSARRMRQKFDTLMQGLDPEGNDPGPRQSVMLTHSMGGILAKTMIVDPGLAFWKPAFQVPISNMDLTPSERAELKEAFLWKSRPQIRRVIYTACPHRGSEFAVNWVGRIGSWLVRPPRDFAGFFREIGRKNPDAFSDSYRTFAWEKFSSVMSLSKETVPHAVLDGLPLARGVQVHSIIGDRGKPGILAESSDGIVPYSSSHEPRAVSEKIVPAGHGAFEHPDALLEIKRILLSAP